MSELALFRRVGELALVFVALSLPLGRLGTGERSANDLARAQLPVDLAIIGDSRAHAGVSPTRLIEALAVAGLPGHSGRNFGLDGSDVLHQFELVDHALLSASPRPRVIIWAPNPLGFNDKRTSNRLGQIVGLDLEMLRRAGAPLELLLDLATMRAFPPYRQRPFLTERVGFYVEVAGKKTLPLQRRVLGLSYVEPPRSREYHPLPDGHEPFTVLDWQDRFERGARAYELDYAGLRSTAWHLRVGEELLRRAHEAGVLVVVVELPTSPWFRDHLATRPEHLAWRRALAAAAQRYGALYWDDSARYDDDHLFGDPAHMAEPTAFAYSSLLGEALAKDPTVRAALGRGR